MNGAVSTGKETRMKPLSRSEAFRLAFQRVNRTSIVVLTDHESTDYPVPYRLIAFRRSGTLRAMIVVQS
jgi:hypothetical protein